MSEKKNVPKLRFPEFTEPWEQRKWIDTVDISTEMVDPTSGEYDDMPHIAPGNIESFTGRILDNVKTVKEEQLISGKFRFRPNDVVYGKINPQLGKYFYSCVNGLTSADAYVFNGKHGITQKFLFALLQTSDFFKYSVSVSKRSGMPKINRDELNAYVFLAPREEEQDKIGSFLLNIDHLITLHQRKLDHVKDLKKSMLQKMFPKNGQLYPEVRFPEFTDAWEQRKLGEISDKVTKKNQDVVVDEVFTNSAEYGIISQRDFFDKDIANTENIDGYYVVEPNDFVYNPRISTTAPFGPIKRNKLERSGAMSPLYYVFRPNNVDLSYLEWFFQTSCWYPFMRFNGNSGARSDRFAITDKIFNEMPISLPQDIEEQKRIGMLLTTLDTLITLHQRELDHLKLLKKGMLQQMFV